MSTNNTPPPDLDYGLMDAETGDPITCVAPSDELIAASLADPYGTGIVLMDDNGDLLATGRDGRRVYYVE